MMYDVNWKVLTSLVSSSHIKYVTLWVNGMSFRSATHQRLVRSCASTWLREHHVCEKCWKSETNSLTELIVTDPDVFFPRILWKCFNNLRVGGERGVLAALFDLCYCDAAHQSPETDIRLGQESFSDVQLLSMCSGRAGTLHNVWKVLTSPIFPSLSSDGASEAENRFVSGTNGPFQHHGIISSRPCVFDTILKFIGNAWHTIAFKMMSNYPKVNV